jgi:hypothetical protein
MIKLPMKKSFIFNIFLITFMLLPFAIEAKPVAAVAYIYGTPTDQWLWLL